METRRSDTMAGGSDAAGLAPDVQHQPPGISGLSAVEKEVRISLDQPGMF